MMYGISKESKIEWIVCTEREEENNVCFWENVVKRALCALIW